MLTNSGCGCNCNCKRSCSCTGIAIFASIIAGIIGGVLFYTGVITTSLVIAYAAFGVAALGVIIAFLCAAVSAPSVQRCVCDTLVPLLTGAVGAFALAVLISSVTITVGNVLSSILIGIAVLFIALTVSTIICAILCIAGCTQNNDN